MVHFEEIVAHACYSTQKILHNARLAERGVIKADPVKESLSLELDMINIL